MSVQKKIKENIELFYNSDAVSNMKMWLPLVFRLSLNMQTGKPWHNGMILSLLSTSGNNDNSMTCLFYSGLSQNGYGKHTTVFAAKMLSNLIYGGKAPSDNGYYQFSDLTAAIIIDSSNFILAHTGAYTIIGDSWMRQCLVSFLSRFIIGTAVGAAVNEDGLNMKVIEHGLIASLGDIFMPMEGASPIIHVLPTSVYSWLHETTVAFTDAGLGVAA